MDLRLVVDHSIAEIFLTSTGQVLTLRCYPQAPAPGDYRSAHRPAPASAAPSTRGNSTPSRSRNRLPSGARTHFPHSSNNAARHRSCRARSPRPRLRRRSRR
ncbi:hypothetical protein [Streptomyces sp. DG1A-41]|uniref:hypothetical protein n=1 Tax=Streptomyces sp. DG1A-41 TaxID=3125779 RepID=UPI0030D19E4F